MSRDTQLDIKTKLQGNLVIDRIAIDKLCLSDAKPEGFVPKPSPSLKRRIEVHGVVDPIIVRPLGNTERFEILSNPETWVAAGQVGLHQVPVLIRDDLNAEGAAAIVQDHYGATTNSPIDEAETFLEQLQRCGGRDQRGAITKLSTLTGRPRPYIAHALRLLKLPEIIREYIRAGRMTAGHARPLVGLGSRTAQIYIAKKIIAERLTVRATEALVRAHRTSKENSDIQKPATQKSNDTAVEKSADIRQLEQAITNLLGCRFELRGNEAVIDYYGNIEILEGVLKKLGYATD